MQSRICTAIALAVAMAMPIGALAASTAPPPNTSPTGSPPDKSDRSAPADTADAKSVPSFKQLDKNKDGFVSRDEAQKSSSLSARFDELDLDRDGKLSQSELDAAKRPAAGRSSGSSMGSSGGSPKQSY
jgi:hypothetical protein